MRLDAIVIHPYDPEWPARFEHERERITPLLGSWLARDIEHMGSTAVPGLPAKAIIDMLAVVDDISSRADATELLTPAGWLHAPEPTDEGDRKLSFCFPSVERRTYHLHVVEESSTPWRGWLAFRDYLRVHDNARVEYAELKARLAAAHGGDPNERDAYRAGKAAFVRAITARALGPD